MKIPRYSWPAGLGLLTLILVTELLPVLGGRGDAARFDWSFAYVTLHFVLLPLASGIHLFWNLAGLISGEKKPLRLRLFYLSSGVISLGYLLLLVLHPVFPFWADTTWQTYIAHPPWN